ncbi:MAG: hypothetical protein JO309_15680 [Pseudonocardiales bacterium]|nr:hypothetical protein [Pseudonocardiales bacterium]
MSGKHHQPPWWRRGRGAGHQAPAGLRRSLTEMVDGAGWAHLLTTEAFEAGLREGAGRYEALCGRRIISASLAARRISYCRPCQVLETWT